MSGSNPYPYKRNPSELESSQYWLWETRQWVERNGGNASGYQAHYAGHYPPDQIQAIYEADVEAVAKAEERLTRAQKRSRTRQPSLPFS